MGDIQGFLKHGRELPARRPVPVRLKDWKEVYEPFAEGKLETQASRCMDCGIPFCNNGCPLGNLIPDWNDLVYRDRWQDAIERLHATNNFPEFTGRLCPAPCEAACVLGINQDPVTIKQVEVSIIDRAWDEGWVQPVLPSVDRQEGGGGRLRPGRPGRRPAAHPRRPHRGGVRAGRPHRRPAALRHPRVQDGEAPPRPAPRADGGRGHRVPHRRQRGSGTSPAISSSADFDAVVLAGGATTARDLPIPGRELGGIHQAMEYLPHANRVQEGDLERSPIEVAGKNVVIIGGGDTGADCLGTAHRQGAASIRAVRDHAPPARPGPITTPWPTWPLVYRTASAHEEGGERVFSVNTECFLDDGNGRVKALLAHEVEMVDGRFEKVEGTDFEIEADFVFLAMGFTGPESSWITEQFGVELDGRSNVARDDRWATNVPGVYVAGDMGRGQSLIVWAIAEGRSCAAAVDEHLMGETLLPRPLEPTAAPIR